MDSFVYAIFIYLKLSLVSKSKHFAKTVTRSIHAVTLILELDIIV